MHSKHYNEYEIDIYRKILSKRKEKFNKMRFFSFDTKIDFTQLKYVFITLYILLFRLKI